MPRNLLYGEETESFNAKIPVSVKRALQVAAQERHLTASQFVTMVLREWLETHAEVAVG